MRDATAAVSTPDAQASDAGTFDDGGVLVDAGPPAPIPGLRAHFRFDEGQTAPEPGAGYRPFTYGTADKTVSAMTSPSCIVEWDTGFVGAQFPNPHGMRVKVGPILLKMSSSALPRIHAPQTLAFWMNMPVQMAPAGSNPFLLVLKARTPSQSDDMSLVFRLAGDHEIHLDVAYTGGAHALESATLQPGWMHLAYVFDGGHFRLYIDGTKRDESAGSPGPLAYDSYDVNGSMIQSRYTIDDLRQYDHALTDAELTALAAGAP